MSIIFLAGLWCFDHTAQDVVLNTKCRATFAALNARSRPKFADRLSRYRKKSSSQVQELSDTLIPHIARSPGRIDNSYFGNWGLLALCGYYADPGRSQIFGRSGPKGKTAAADLWPSGADLFAARRQHVADRRAGDILFR